MPFSARIGAVHRILSGLDPRGERKQVADLPAVQGQVMDTHGVLYIADLRAFGSDRRCRGLHIDNRLQLPHFERRFDGNGLAGLHLKAALPFAKPGGLDGNQICSDGYAAEIVDAG